MATSFAAKAQWLQVHENGVLADVVQIPSEAGSLHSRAYSLENPSKQAQHRTLFTQALFSQAQSPNLVYVSNGGSKAQQRRHIQHALPKLKLQAVYDKHQRQHQTSYDGSSNANQTKDRVFTNLVLNPKSPGQGSTPPKVGTRMRTIPSIQSNNEAPSPSPRTPGKVSSKPNSPQKTTKGNQLPNWQQMKEKNLNNFKQFQMQNLSNHPAICATTPVIGRSIDIRQQHGDGTSKNEVSASIRHGSQPSIGQEKGKKAPGAFALSHSKLHQEPAAGTPRKAEPPRTKSAQRASKMSFSNNIQSQSHVRTLSSDSARQLEKMSSIHIPNNMKGTEEFLDTTRNNNHDLGGWTQSREEEKVERLARDLMLTSSEEQQTAGTPRKHVRQHAQGGAPFVQAAPGTTAAAPVLVRRELNIPDYGPPDPALRTVVAPPEHTQGSNEGLRKNARMPTSEDDCSPRAEEKRPEAKQAPQADGKSRSTKRIRRVSNANGEATARSQAEGLSELETQRNLLPQYFSGQAYGEYLKSKAAMGHLQAQGVQSLQGSSLPAGVPMRAPMPLPPSSPFSSATASTPAAAERIQVPAPHLGQLESPGRDEVATHRPNQPTKPRSPAKTRRVQEYLAPLASIRDNQSYLEAFTNSKTHRPFIFLKSQKQKQQAESNKTRLMSNRDAITAFSNGDGMNGGEIRFSTVHGKRKRSDTRDGAFGMDQIKWSIEQPPATAQPGTQRFMQRRSTLQDAGDKTEATHSVSRPDEIMREAATRRGGTARTHFGDAFHQSFISSELASAQTSVDRRKPKIKSLLLTFAKRLGGSQHEKKPWPTKQTPTGDIGEKAMLPAWQECLFKQNLVKQGVPIGKQKGKKSSQKEAKRRIRLLDQPAQPFIIMNSTFEAEQTNIVTQIFTNETIMNLEDRKKSSVMSKQPNQCESALRTQTPPVQMSIAPASHVEVILNKSKHQIETQAPDKAKLDGPGLFDPDFNGMGDQVEANINNFSMNSKVLATQVQLKVLDHGHKQQRQNETWQPESRQIVLSAREHMSRNWNAADYGKRRPAPGAGKVAVADDIEVREYDRQSSALREKPENAASGPYRRSTMTMGAANQHPGLRIPTGCTMRKEEAEEGDRRAQGQEEVRRSMQFSPDVPKAQQRTPDAEHAHAANGAPVSLEQALSALTQFNEDRNTPNDDRPNSQRQSPDSLGANTYRGRIQKIRGNPFKKFMTAETTDGRKFTQSLLRAIVQTDSSLVEEARDFRGMQMEGVGTKPMMAMDQEKSPNVGGEQFSEVESMDMANCQASYMNVKYVSDTKAQPEGEETPTRSGERKEETGGSCAATLAGEQQDISADKRAESNKKTEGDSSPAPKERIAAKYPATKNTRTETQGSMATQEGCTSAPSLKAKEKAEDARALEQKLRQNVTTSIQEGSPHQHLSIPQYLSGTVIDTTPHQHCIQNNKPQREYVSIAQAGTRMNGKQRPGRGGLIEDKIQYYQAEPEFLQLLQRQEAQKLKRNHKKTSSLVTDKHLAARNFTFVASTEGPTRAVKAHAPQNKPLVTVKEASARPQNIVHVMSLAGNDSIAEIIENNHSSREMTAKIVATSQQRHREDHQSQKYKGPPTDRGKSLHNKSCNLVDDTNTLLKSRSKQTSNDLTSKHTQRPKGMHSMVFHNVI